MKVESNSRNFEIWMFKKQETLRSHEWVALALPNNKFVLWLYLCLPWLWQRPCKQRYIYKVLRLPYISSSTIWIKRDDFAQIRRLSARRDETKRNAELRLLLNIAFRWWKFLQARKSKFLSDKIALLDKLRSKGNFFLLIFSNVLEEFLNWECFKEEKKKVQTRYNYSFEIARSRHDWVYIFITLHLIKNLCLVQNHSSTRKRVCLFVIQIIPFDFGSKTVVLALVEGAIYEASDYVQGQIASTGFGQKNKIISIFANQLKCPDTDIINKN